MRLCSADYEDFYPFNTGNFLRLFDTFAVVHFPDQLKEGDVLLVWGGADIWPGLYNKALAQRSHADSKPSMRDNVEWNLMKQAEKLNIPIIGICRGAQMLCALAGGYLMQHITGHGGTHMVTTYDGKEFLTNSLHHQMMVPVSPDGSPVPHQIVASIPPDKLRSKEYWDEDTNKVDHKQEPEFIYFNKVKGFAVQWHPEMMGPGAPATEYIYSFMEKHLVSCHC